MRHLIACLFALTVASGAARAQEDELLPVEQAFALDAKIVEAGKVALHWQIAPDYYMYRSRIKAKSSQAGVTLGTLELPAGEQKHDEFLGDVEVYHHAVDAVLPYSITDAAAKTLTVTVTAQGCHEVDPKICYPPHPTKLTLDLPAADAATNAPVALGTGSSSPLISLGANGPAGGMDAEPLPPEQAFVFEAIAASPTGILARWTMPRGYYLYRDKSTVTLAQGEGVRLGAPRWPQGVDHTDEHFGTVQVYFDQVELPIALARENGAPQTVRVHAEYQGCQDDGLCYPVMQKDIDVELPAASAEQLAAANASFVTPQESGAASTTASAAQPSALSARPSALDILGALLLALGGGLILNLMPCVLPVLSLKVLGLAQSGESLAKARTHALWYTAGVLVAFAAVGLAVVGLRAAGAALGWGFQLQQPVFVALLVYVLFAIGLSLSGVFNFGAGLAGVGQGLASRSGPAG
ncbi:MAG TPA: protein-disulfide reductase DsbD domain-containing protein, partial [Dokdonella sp.]